MSSHDDDEIPLDWPTDEELADYGYIPKSRRVRLINSTPRVGQAFWIDFPHDAYTPEFVSEHPCVVVRAAQNIDHDTCIIVPLTTALQKDHVHTHELSKNPNPKHPRRKVYAVCNHLYTVNIARLRPFRNKTGLPVYPKVAQADLDEIFAKIRVSLHHVYGAPTQPEAAAAPPTITVVTKPKRRTVKLKPPETAPEAPKIGPSGKAILTLPKKKEDP